ncbi:hypothetical protein PMAYCL1PPCAC_27899, partial [Pristionchus mayeri]
HFQVTYLNTTNDAGEKPMEIKNEPIDEFPELKLEEPMKDIFYPSTGTCRPFGEPSYITDVPPKTKEYHHLCVVCQQMQNERKMHRFIKNRKKRTIWVNSVRPTPKGRRSLMDKLRATKRPYLCASHFCPSDYILNSKRTSLRFDAVPYFEVSSVEPVSAIEEESIVFKDESIDFFRDVKLDDEPMADIYCPLSGTSGPLTQVNVPDEQYSALFGEVLKKREMEDEEPGPSIAFLSTCSTS